MKTYSCAELVRLGRQLPTPFCVEIAEEESLEKIEITEILRIVPQKRFIAIANWRGSNVIVKLFFGPLHWKRNLAKDISGITLLRERNLRTPSLLHNALTAGNNGAALIMQYLSDGKTLTECMQNAVTSHERHSLLSLATRSIATCHRFGLRQIDVHMDNFLLSDKEVYYLDGGQIQVQGESLEEELAYDNFALFLAQFKVENDEAIGDLLHEYHLENKTCSAPVYADILRRVKRARNLRLINYEKKLLRSTTANRNIRSLDKFVVYDREIHSPSLEDFISDPNRYIVKDKLMKDGNASTVAELFLDGKGYVLKRYNFRSLWHSIKYQFKPSRAARSWCNASILSMLGVYTPRPYLFIEERFAGFLKHKAYFLAEKIEAVNLWELTEKEEFSTAELSKITDSFRKLFNIMIDYKISHGDMKATNFIFYEDKLLVLDLDAMKRHGSKRSFYRAIQKDLDRFMKNWRESPHEEEFRKVIDELKLPAEPNF